MAEKPDQAAGRYRLTLEGDGLRLERMLGRDDAHRVLAMVLGLSPSPPSSSGAAVASAAASAAAGGPPLLSAREFVDASHAASNPEKIVAFAVHLERDEGKPHFTRLDIKRCFAEAREAPPRNLNRDFVTAVSYGWIHEEANGRAYATTTGRAAVDARFATVARKPRRGDTP
jgi:hypothetical protein